MESADPIYSKVVQYLDQVKNCLSNGDHGRAYAFLLLILKLKPGMRFAIEDEFKEAWTGWSTKLVNLRRLRDVISLYEQGCEAFPECEDLHLTMGELFYNMGQKLAAHNTYNRVLCLNPVNMVARECIDNLCRSMIDNWHFPMLNDIERNSKFYHAIGDHIADAHRSKQEINVLDIGSGTGILSLFAAQAGSKSAVACESCPTLSDIAKEVIKGSGMEGKITTVNSVSTDLKIDQSNLNEDGITLPSQVSLVVSELVDAGGFGEGIVKTLNHAWKELLLSPKEGGTVIPSKIKMKALCIESAPIHRKHCMSPTTGNSILITSNVGINLQIDDTKVSENLLVMCDTEEPYTSEKLSRIEHRTLSGCHVIQEVDFNNPALLSNLMASGYSPLEVKISATQNGFLDAVVLCFELSLDKGDSPKYILDTFIGGKNCWEQAIYPTRKMISCQGKLNFSRIPIKEGDVVTLHLLQYHDKIILRKCHIAGNEFSGNGLDLPQYSEFSNEIPKESFAIVLNEEAVAGLNNSHFWYPFKHSFTTWLGERSKEWGNFDSMKMAGGDAVKTSNGCHSRHDPLLVADMMEGLSIIMLEFASYFTDVQFHKICRDDNSEKLRLCADFMNLRNYFFVTDPKPEIKYDAIFIDMVERSGMFRQDAFLNMIWAKTLLRPGGVIFPSKVKLMGLLIESQELVEQCSVPCPDNTMGFNIGRHLKPLQANTLSHVNMRTTNFKAISSPFVCLELDTRNTTRSQVYESTAKVEVPVNDSGIIHGMLLWHILEVFNDMTCDTSDPRNDCLQCVVMETGDTLQVTPDDYVCVAIHRRLSYVAADIHKARDRS